MRKSKKNKISMYSHSEGMIFRMAIFLAFFWLKKIKDKSQQKKTA